MKLQKNVENLLVIENKKERTATIKKRKPKYFMRRKYASSSNIRRENLSQMGRSTCKFSSKCETSSATDNLILKLHPCLSIESKLTQIEWSS